MPSESAALAASTTVPTGTTAALAGAATDTVGAVLDVMTTVAVAVAPKLSVAVADRLCAPEAKVATTENGEELSVATKVAPS